MRNDNILPWAEILEESKVRKQQIKREKRLKALTIAAYVALITCCIAVTAFSIYAVTHAEYKTNEYGQIY